jgi:hypothetical protein
MTEKEMVSHIKALSRIIEKQNSHVEQISRNFYSVNRELSILQVRLARLEGIKRDLD